jgi:hypothetical protein
MNKIVTQLFYHNLYSIDMNYFMILLFNLLRIIKIMELKMELSSLLFMGECMFVGILVNKMDII